MTRKDYIAIAAVFAQKRAEIRSDDRSFALGAKSENFAIACSLADVLAADNPRFNRTTFLLACGVGTPDPVDADERFRYALINHIG